MKFIIIIVLCICNTAYSQNKTLSLEILSNGKALQGATILLQKEGKACVSDKHGRATIEYNTITNETIRVSFVGYVSYQTILYDQSFLRIKLKEDNKYLQEFIVVSKKQNLLLREKSLNIDLVNTSFLNKNNAGSLMKSLNSIAGISSIDIGSGQSKPVIRGLSFNRLAVSENGVKHEGQQWGSDHGLEIDQYAIDNIEIIKGPSSLMYGSDAIAGMIVIHTKQKPLKNGFDATLFNSFRTNNMSYTSSLNMQYKRKHFYINSQFTYTDYADYKLPTDSISIYSFRVPLHKRSLRNTAGNNKSIYICSAYYDDNLESKFIFSNYNANSGLFANAHGLEPRSVNEELYDKSARDINHPSQYVNHMKISNQTVFSYDNSLVTTNLSYQKNIRKEYAQYTSHGFMPAAISSSFLGKENIERSFDKDIVSAKAKYEFTHLKHSFIIGVSSQYQNNNIGGWSFIIPEFEQFKLGAFVYDKFELNNKVFLHLGVRFDKAKLKIYSYTDWFKSEIKSNGQTGNLQRVNATNKNFNNISAAIGVNVNLDNLLLKFNFAKSYRLPSAKELSANGVNYHYFSYEKGNPHLSPEEAYQIDLGLNYSLGILKVNFTPFLSYFPNYIFLNPSAKRDYSYGAGNQIYNYTQTKLLRYGGEFTLDYYFTEYLKLKSSSEYVYSEQLSGSKKGFSLPFSPPASTRLSVEYSIDRKANFVNIFFNLGFKITAAQNRIVPPERKTPGYNLLDFTCGTKYYIKNSYLDFNLKINNLLNKKYYNHMSFYRLIDVPEAGRDLIFSLKMPLGIFL